MAVKKGIRKICANGHVFYKSSDCPVCPICEKQKAVTADFLSVLSAPARRALENAGIKTLNKLSKKVKQKYYNCTAWDHLPYRNSKRL